MAYTNDYTLHMVSVGCQRKGGTMGSEQTPAGGASRTFEFLWREGDRPRRSPGPRPGLSVTRVVVAAIAIADADGIDAVSMQQVAKRLEVTPMSLYRYVPSKKHLVEAMFDEASGAPPGLDAVPGGWQVRVEAWAMALWNRYQAHPWMLRAQVSQPIGPNQLAWLEALLAVIKDIGLTYEEMMSLALFLTGATQGLARISTDLARAAGEDDLISFGEALAAVARPDRFPTLSALQSAGTFDLPDGPADGAAREVEPNLTFGLRQLLKGIEAHVAARAERG